MVPNRLVLFDPGQFHQAQEYFGDSKSSARLIHNFFFRHIPAHFDPARAGADTDAAAAAAPLNRR